MPPSRFTLTPAELVVFHECLSSRICTHIFQILLEKGSLNISAISRRVGCTNSDGLKHLNNLVRLGIVHEEFYAGRHTFTLKKGDHTELMRQAIEAMEAEEDG